MKERPGIYRTMWEALAMLGVCAAFWAVMWLVVALACRQTPEPEPSPVTLPAATAER